MHKRLPLGYTKAKTEDYKKISFCICSKKWGLYNRNHSISTGLGSGGQKFPKSMTWLLSHSTVDRTEAVTFSLQEQKDFVWLRTRQDVRLRTTLLIWRELVLGRGFFNPFLHENNCRNLTTGDIFNIVMSIHNWFETFLPRYPFSQAKRTVQNNAISFELSRVPTFRIWPKEHMCRFLKWCNVQNSFVSALWAFSFSLKRRNSQKNDDK